jgi:hypothetical protein
LSRRPIWEKSSECDLRLDYPDRRRLMAKESPRYNVRAIRELLLEAFTAEEFQDLLYFAKTPELREVPDKFAPGDSYPAMVRKALRYCDSHYLLCELLAAVKEANPRAFEQFEGTLRAPVSAVPSRTRPNWLVPALAAGAVVVVILLAVVLVLMWPGPDRDEPEPTPAAQITETPTATGTPMATGNPTPSAGTSTSIVSPSSPSSASPSATSTTTPSPSPTLTVVLESEREFVVVYTGVGSDNYVTIRKQPVTSSASVATVYAGDRLVVRGVPVTGSSSLWWPVRTQANVEGWVIEWWNGYRLIKPFIIDGDTVEVVRPQTPLLRDEDCNFLLYLSPGTLLGVEGGSDRSKCDEPGDTQAGREWWMVKTPAGDEGWAADFDIHAYTKPMQIAPPWYAELAE